MNLGEVIESSIWLTGKETRRDRLRYETDVRNAIADLCRQESNVYGPVEFRELNPGHEDLKHDVPGHIQGPDVRLLVAQATVTGFVIAPAGFVGELDRADHQRLRKITRNVYAITHNGARLTDMECDDYIEIAGPEAALDTLRRKV